VICFARSGVPFPVQIAKEWSKLTINHGQTFPPENPEADDGYEEPIGIQHVCFGLVTNRGFFGILTDLALGLLWMRNCP
jgi:hypothetical protein